MNTTKLKKLFTKMVKAHDKYTACENEFGAELQKYLPVGAFVLYQPSDGFCICTNEGGQNMLVSRLISELANKSTLSIDDIRRCEV